MRKVSKVGATEIAVVIGLLVHAAPAAADPAVGAALTVIVVRGVTLPSAVVDQAEAEAAKIFARMGVHINWRESGAQTTAVAATPPYFLLIPSKAPSSAGENLDPMGAAPGAGKTDARLAYAYYLSVDALARAHNIDVAVLLGNVIAHELGHLLLPFPSHSATGIMYGAWDTEHLSLVAQGALQFSSSQATQVRGKLLNDPAVRP